MHLSRSAIVKSLNLLKDWRKNTPVNSGAVLPSAVMFRVVGLRSKTIRWHLDNWKGSSTWPGITFPAVGRLGMLLSLCILAHSGGCAAYAQLDCVKTSAGGCLILSQSLAPAQIQQGVSAPERYDASARSATSGTGTYVDRSGADQVQLQGVPAPAPNATPEPATDFQRLAQASTGELLPIFGHDLFQAVPSTFAPGNQIAISPDYVVGPGDDVLLRIWGPEAFNGQLTVDSSGAIYLPKIGAIHIAGLRFEELQKQINDALSRTYRNFDTSVNLGHLRSIQVYVVGEARHPGAYTVSSLSTVLNALFASGGPNAQGSLRHIQVRRAGRAASEFDLYDFILHGDKSKDIPLESGDTIFIPAAGPEVALGGSVRHPAIYELAKQSSIQDLLDLAGGFTPTASADRLSLERIQDDRARYATTISLDRSGRGMPLSDGDVIFVHHITDAYNKTVTIRGNLANPGRFAWHQGMRLSDIIPDRESLLTTGYWEQRNRLGVPVPLFDRAVETDQPAAPSASTTTLNPDGGTAPQVSAGQSRLSTAPIAATPLPQQRIATDGQPPSRNLIRIPAPEIDWSYAVIERLDPKTLKNSLVPFNLGRLIQDGDQAQNLELQPGDTVTILSQNDVSVPQEMRTKYIRLEGEFVSSGVYSVGPKDTLADVVRRAGGFTSDAYLYGSNFTRESARVFQQQRLDEYISSLSADMERAAVDRSSTSVTGTADPTTISEQHLFIEQLRQLRATGRVVLEFTPESAGADVVPNVQLEDGDVFQVPAKPSTVSVVGAVYGQNVFLFSPSRKLADYVALAGKPNRIADRKHAFIIRADGSVFSRGSAQGTLSNNFESTRINPGDSIVVPEKLIKPPFLRDLIAYSQVLSGFGLAAAAVEVIK